MWFYTFYMFYTVNHIVRILVADVFKKRAKQRFVTWERAGCDLLRDPFAEDAAEIVVAHKRKKRTRVRRHSDKSREDSVSRVLFKDISYSLFMVAPPPRGAKLHLAWHSLFVERARKHRK